MNEHDDGSYVILTEIGDLVVQAQQLGTLIISNYCGNTEVEIDVGNRAYYGGADGAGGQAILDALDEALCDIPEAA